MTVAQLKEELSKYPDNMNVFMKQLISDFEYELTDHIYQEEIPFSEEPGSRKLAKDKVVIISD